MTEKRVTTDWEGINLSAVESIAQQSIATGAKIGHEADIIRLFKMCVLAQQFDERLSLSIHDSVVYEMAFKFGRADIVIFHMDGSATVIEVKNGDGGYNHVVAGIGQAGLYAAQLGMNKGALNQVRKALLWTSTGNIACDAAIEVTCEQSGLIALPWGRLGVHLAYVNAVHTAFNGGGE